MYITLRGVSTKLYVGANAGIQYLEKLSLAYKWNNEQKTGGCPWKSDGMSVAVRAERRNEIKVHSYRWS